ncbi:MAG: 50S ribosomal protein L20 [Patescibacteria group bacterium]
MTRVKRGTTSLKRRRKVLKLAKGYRYGLSTKERQAKMAVIHAAMHAFRHRRRKKGDFRRLWQVRISAVVQGLGLSYSKLIDALNKKNIKLNRKILSEIAQDSPEVFEKIVAEVKK